ncbi:MAG TPA: tryptophan-rich sensory protein [Lamprocystis sp. (in: g-proteobacteria)]|nr:tryptophan-rich sensory protein [Lamprocystis sp. (in: g-proteobacteria)]
MATRYAYKPGLAALAFYIFIALALAAVVNAIIVFFDVAEWTEQLKKPAFALSGLQIGLAWEALFACMAGAIWFIRRTPPLPARRAASTAMSAMVVAVLAFPFYALLPQSLFNSFVGTFASAFIAWIVCGIVFFNSKWAGALMLPLALWLTFASVVAFDMQRMNPPAGLLG